MAPLVMTVGGRERGRRMEAARHVVRFSFNGRAFRGYARQPGGGTVEDELIGALKAARLIDGSKEAHFSSASRVDRGVSAISAAAAFDSRAPAGRILRSVNSRTPNVLVHSIATVEEGFDPRRRAVSRWYRYHFPPSGMPSGLDLVSMKEAAELFLGEHDYTAFARLEGRNPRRVITEISVERWSGSVVMDVRGKTFLWNQVRRMASALHMVGTGRAGTDDIAGALATGNGGPFPPSPPEGLFLMDVVFDGLEFEPANDLPKGTLERLRDERHAELCSLSYYDYIGEKVRF